MKTVAIVAAAFAPVREFRRRASLLLLGVVALAIVVAGCGSAIPSSHGGPATLKVERSKLGRFLADRQGHALYLFKRDGKNESYCAGACASVWPPYVTKGAPQVAGASGGMLGTLKRDDGDTQVTYSGLPLYYYAGDASRPGETKGEGIKQFGAEWYLVSPNGKELDSGGSS